MYICLDCNKCFDHPEVYTETHGLERPPYESFCACPYCGGDYARAYKCMCCDEWILGTYIKTADGDRICENCYNTYEIGEEE